MDTQINNLVHLKGVRGAIAKKMIHSLQSSAQLSFHAEANISPLLDCKRQLSAQGNNVSLQDMLHLVIIATLGRHMHLNGKLENNAITYDPDIHLSFAVSLADNLLVTPTIFSAQHLTITELQQLRHEATGKAQRNELKPKDYTGGSITITNLGLSRVKYFTPILNTPQIAILGLGATTESYKLNAAGELEATKLMGLSLTVDHRAIDGVPAANFLSDLCTNIEEIECE